ncbi:SGNH/GDSL hydrolase family protein [Candidatus Magnetominusculus dajiuhuensis]|uniref:SGNH/GDSL hydrolase family protein n=1 Tax=Candidatus Magnetominusculus dajiuhuensis TaxID=3137712 RepID=UPI003B42D67B
MKAFRRIKRVVKNILLITIPVVVLLLVAMEIVFRYVIPASESPLVYYDEKDKISKLDNRETSDGLFTAGNLAQLRVKWHINGDGFRSDIAYSTEHKKPLIAVIGDSFVEALQVNMKDTMASKLKDKLHGQFDVYSFGVNGASLSQYLQTSRYVNKRFAPDILVFNIVHNDFDESLCSMILMSGFMCLEENGTGFTETIKPAVASRNKTLFKRFIFERSALLRYLWVNLSLKRSISSLSIYNKIFAGGTGKFYNANVDVQRLAGLKPKLYGVADYLMGKIKEENPNKKVFFIMDAPRADIYDGTLNSSSVIWLNRLFMKTCMAHDFNCVDLTEYFYRHYKATHVHFESPYDWHWNEHGHESAAEALFNEMKMAGVGAK